MNVKGASGEVSDRNKECVIGNWISKQSIEGTAWFLLAAYSNIWEGREKLKRELLRKKEPQFQYLENSKPIHVAKHKKACFGKNTKGIAR